MAWRGSTDEVAVLGVRGRIHDGEVVALEGLGDEPVELRGTDLPGDRSDLGVDPPGGLGSEGG